MAGMYIIYCDIQLECFLQLFFFNAFYYDTNHELLIGYDHIR